MTGGFGKGAPGGAVLGEAIQHPSVVYPAALGILGALGALALSTPLLFTAAAASGGVAVLGLGANLLLRRDALAREVLARTQRETRAQRDAMRKDLEEDLRRAKAVEAISQFVRFQEKMKTFETLLAERLQQGELTAVRFLAIAEQVLQAGFENLRTIGLLQEARAAIDTAYIRQRVEALERQRNPAAAQRDELRHLKEQLAQHEQNGERIHTCLAENEQALGEMGRCNASIAQMKTGESAGVSMEAAMAELARIAQRARDYR